MAKLILDELEIKEITKRIAKEISDTLRNDEKIPVLVGVLKGSINFMMDVLKNIDIPVFTDYIQVSSYHGTTSTGHVQFTKDLSFDCHGRSVVIIEDIVDTGISMHYILEHMMIHEPKKIYVCSLFNKQAARKKDVKIDFIGYELKEDYFLLGYGLDYYELERNIPYVYGAEKEDIEELDALLAKSEGSVK